MAEWRAEMCKRNGAKWILGHRAWIEAFSPSPHAAVDVRGLVYSGEFVDDPDRRGFLLLYPMQDPEMERNFSKPSHSVYFILVDEVHRREGVGSALVKTIPDSFHVWLEVVTDDAGEKAEAFWRAQPGFVQTERYSGNRGWVRGDLQFERLPADPAKRGWKREGGRLERA